MRGIAIHKLITLDKLDQCYCKSRSCCSCPMTEIQGACLATRVITRAAAYIIDKATFTSDLQHSFVAHHDNFVDSASNVIEDCLGFADRLHKPKRPCRRLMTLELWGSAAANLSETNTYVYDQFACDSLFSSNKCLIALDKIYILYSFKPCYSLTSDRIHICSIPRLLDA